MLLLLFLVALESALAGCAKPQEMRVSEQHVVEQETESTDDPATQLADESIAESAGESIVETVPAVEARPDAVKPAQQKPVAVADTAPAVSQKVEARPPEISMEQLIERLKNTEAIGFLTKLAIRSDVLDFKQSVESYRKQGVLEENAEMLRGYFNGLLLKILALLERDPALSRDIHLARESIWKSLVEAKS
ncbi:MAG: hypothetical protein RQ867_04460 [Mariprofundaceae bacterium]|nr:hypothetical protein [Mariprofundaceae bacterium]